MLLAPSRPLIKPLELLSSVKQYTLPPIPCSLPVKVHPDFAYLSKVADTWALNSMRVHDSASVAKYVQMRIPLAYCFIVPEGIGEPEMIASCKYIWSTGFIDDPFDEEITTVDRAIEWKGVVLRAAQGKSSPEELQISTIEAYQDLMIELKRTMPSLSWRRFMRAHYAWADHCVELVRRKQYKDPPTVASYLRDRCENLLMEPIYILGEFCMRIELDEEFLSHPEFTEMLFTMLEHVAMVNDTLSIKVDLLNEHYYTLPGLVFLTDPEVSDFQQAVDKVCDMIQEKEREFIRLHEILTCKAKRSSNKANLLKYLDALPNYIAGNLYWHYLSARYHGVDNPMVTGRPFQGTIKIERHVPVETNRHPLLLDVDNLHSDTNACKFCQP